MCFILQPTVMNISGLLFYFLLSYCNSFIIPNEIPTILSIIYSNIPPLKIGIDTRFGWGFRLGQHVDYQSLVEIGPQTNTNPISSNGTAAVAKRQSITLSRIERLNKESLKNGEKQAEKERLQKKQGKDKKPYTAQNVEFKKVPGIDEDTNRRKPGPKSSKQEKPYAESAPTKFSLL